MDRKRPKSSSKSITRVAALTVLAIAVLVGLTAVSRIDFATQRVTRDQVTLGTVERGTLEIKVVGNGRLRSRNTEDLVSVVTGRVLKVDVKGGDTVKAGAPLVQLSNPQLVASADQARWALQGARTGLRASAAELKMNLLTQEVRLNEAKFALAKAKVRLDAESKLAGQQIIAQVTYKQHQLDVMQLSQQLEMEEGRIKAIRANIAVQLAVQRAHVDELAQAAARAENETGNLTIRAGMDGVVQTVDVTVGQELQTGSSVGQIAQPGVLYAQLQVPAREAGQVRAGQSVLVDTHDGTINGEVTRVSPAVAGGTVIVEADLVGPLPNGARPELPVDGTIYVARLADALYVERPPYVTGQSVISMYKLDPKDRYAMRVAVSVGKVSANYVQVVGGLKAGDRVITSDTSQWQSQPRILLD